MITEIIAVVGAVGVLGGLYFKVRQMRRERYPKRAEIFKCTEEFLGRAWSDPNADPLELLGNFTIAKARRDSFSIRDLLVTSTRFMRAWKTILTKN